MVSIGNHPIIGRVIYAGRDFALGDTIFIEQPLMIANEGNDKKIASLLTSKSLDPLVKKILHTLASCSPQQLAKLNDFFFFFDAKNPKHLFFKEFCNQFHAKVPSLLSKFPDSESLFHALLRWEINQHQYKDTSAVFEMASKLAHSCTANASYSTIGREPFQLYAMKPIAKGDMITINYINNDILTYPTHLRRRELVDNYFFHCKCDRCISPDSVREIKCQSPSSLCREGMLRSDDGLWKCNGCAFTASDNDIEILLRFETEVERKYFNWDSYMSDMINGHARIMQDLHSILETAKEADERLGPNHWLTARFSSLIFEICTELDLERGLQWILWICRKMVELIPLSVYVAISALRLCVEKKYKIKELRSICKVFLPIWEARNGVDKDSIMMKEVIEMCQVCGKKQGSKCMRCKEARYCSKECQKADWKTHKDVCKASQ